ncbi:MAG TPA: amino acid racemase [Paracoccaceae bacterium]|nr:amino acid racemase [Paracoccaceae bacterium]
MRTVGILGGMGPEATVLLMARVIAATPARDDHDHIPLIVHQNPQVPSRIRRLIEGTGDDPAPVLAGMARDLERAGAQALAMPCNTAHAYAGAVRGATALPFLDMRDATVSALAGAARIGLLASPAVRLTGAFDAAFAQAGMAAVWPADEIPVLNLIRRVKAGDTGAEARAALSALAIDMAGQCDRVLIACTELSLLTADCPVPFTDSLDCLVDAIRAFATGADQSSS